MLADGRVMEVLMREVQVLVIGMTGMGKSNLLNVLCGLLTRCPDAMVWMIEFKGGRLPAPWIRPWAEHRAPRPAIDWVATTREEAEKMLRAADRLCDARSESLKGGSKIAPDRDTPQLIILVDEASDIIGSGKAKAEQKGEGISNARLAEIGDRMTGKGRSEAVMMEWGTQRATVSKLGSGDLKSQCGLRFALRTASEADASSIIPDDYAAARQLTKLRHNGSGLVWTQGGGRPQPVKFYRLDTHVSMDMERTLALAIENAACRPEFGPADTAALGEDYRTRWDRSELLARLRRSAPAAPASPQGPESEQSAPRRPVAVLDRETEAAEFHALTDGLAGDMDIPPEARKIHPSRAQIYAWLATRPDFGLDVPTMATMLRKAPGVPEVALGTLYKWMRADIAAGLIEERNGRYFMRRDRGQR
jgi:energy-coupling factor transporter ATP-binding protein EcfA2